MTIPESLSVLVECSVDHRFPLRVTSLSLGDLDALLRYGASPRIGEEVSRTWQRTRGGSRSACRRRAHRVEQNRVTTPARRHREAAPDCEDYLNEMPGILDVFGLEKLPDYTSFCSWEKEISVGNYRHWYLLRTRVCEDLIHFYKHLLRRASYVFGAGQSQRRGVHV